MSKNSKNFIHNKYLQIIVRNFYRPFVQYMFVANILYMKQLKLVGSVAFVVQALNANLLTNLMKVVQVTLNKLKIKISFTHQQQEESSELLAKKTKAEVENIIFECEKVMSDKEFYKLLSNIQSLVN